MAYPAKGKKSTGKDGAAFQTLKQAISTGDIGNLYIFYGEETYLRDYYLQALRKKLLPSGMEAFQYHVLEAKDCSVYRLRELTDTIPLFGGRTLIVVHDFDLFKGDAHTREHMESLLRDLPEYVCLVFLYDVIAYQPDNRLKLAKFVNERGAAVHFAQQGRSELVSWIIRHFRSAGHDVSRADALYLIDQCGELMTGLSSEIDKISAYAANKQISRADIDAVVIPQLNAKVFNMIRFLTAGNFDRACFQLSDLLRAQEDPIQILAALGWQIRRLYAAKLALTHRRDAGWLMKTCDIKYSDQAAQMLDSAQRFSLQWCRRAVLLCAEADRAMKSSPTGNQELLTDLLLALSVQTTSA